MLCPRCAYNRYSKPKKPIKKIGRIAKKWIEFRNEYLEQHPPDENGNYQCGICGKPVHVDEVTLDHIIPRSASPKDRFNPLNIQPAHLICNQLKGSQH